MGRRRAKRVRFTAGFAVNRPYVLPDGQVTAMQWRRGQEQTLPLREANRLIRGGLAVEIAMPEPATPEGGSGGDSG